MSSADQTRRSFLWATGASGAALLIGCDRTRSDEPAPVTRTTSAALDAAKAGEPEKEPDVSATEDLMREHGVIRRALVVYREAAARLRTKPSDVPLGSLRDTAKLLRSFGEDYHEKKLEEAYLFPAVKKAGGPASELVDTLIAQHDRGREITDYVIATVGTSVRANVAPLVTALEGFARMYEAHAAFEDTVVFPAWKKTMTASQLDAMSDRFEDIEHETFGKDGFDDAVARIATIERAFGIDLAKLTPPSPKP